MSKLCARVRGHEDSCFSGNVLKRKLVFLFLVITFNLIAPSHLWAQKGETVIDSYTHWATTTSIGTKAILTINDTLIVDGDLILGQGATLNINEGAVCIIHGSLDFGTDGILNIYENALCIIYGDFNLNNKVNLSIGAHLIVGGDLTTTANSNKIETTIDSTAAIYVLGEVDTSQIAGFNCPDPEYYVPYTGSTECNYGDIISLEDNENDTTGIYDLFVSGDGNKGVTPVYSELCDGDAVTISSLEENADWYQWCDSVGHPIANENSFQFHATEPGEYFVKIVVDNTNPDTTVSYRAKVVVSSLPAIYSAWNNDGGVICAGGSASIGASGSSDINWYAGSCGSGILVGTGSQLSVSPDSTTTYFARAFNSTTGCESDDCKSVTVTVAQPPTIVLGTMPVIETEVGTAYIPYSSTTGNPGNFSIDFDAVSEAEEFSDHNNYELVPNNPIAVNIPGGGWGIAPGTYYGVLTVKTYDPVECESVGYPISITIVEAGNDASVTVTVSETTICEGEEVTFTAIPTNGGTSPAYQWQIDGVDVTGANSPTYISSSLTDGQAITCVMTSNLSGVTNNPATSNEIVMTVNPLPATGEIIPD